jgi:hypothetical protein
MSKGTATLNKLAIEADRRCNLNDDGREIRFAIATEIVLIEAKAVFLGIGSENGYIFFASVENNLLIKGTKTFYFLYSAAADARFERYAEIIAHRYLIKSFVEGYGFDVNARVDDLNTLASYRTCFVDYLLSHIAEMNAYVLETVFISRGIKNFIDADAAKLFFISAEPTERAVFFHH